MYSTSKYIFISKILILLALCILVSVLCISISYFIKEVKITSEYKIKNLEYPHEEVKISQKVERYSYLYDTFSIQTVVGVYASPIGMETCEYVNTIIVSRKQLESDDTILDSEYKKAEKIKNKIEKILKENNSEP